MSEVMKKATRDGFGEAIVELGKENKNILVVDVDIGKSCKNTQFMKELPEQHANDGASHQAIEDMGIMRTLPNMTVVMPADYVSAKKLVKASAAYEGPMFLRFTRDAIPVIYDEDVELTIGKAHQIRDGKDVAIIANGDTVRLAIDAAKELESKGISARVLDMHTIKPLDVEAVTAAINEIGKVITVEDHNILNGLGSAVCEVAAEMGKGIVKRVGIQDQFGESAPYERLLAKNGVTVEDIVKIAESL